MTSRWGQTVVLGTGADLFKKQKRPGTARGACDGVEEQWRRHQIPSREVRAKSPPHPPTTSYLIRVPKDTGSLG